MSETLVLQRAAPPKPGIAFLKTGPTADRLLLRGSPEVMMAAGGALGVNLPAPVCRAVVSDKAAVLWLGPDEALFILPQNTGVAALAALSPTLADLPHSVVDVSHRQTGLEIIGPHADAMLATGCPLDLHISTFPIGMCTRTIFAKAEIVLWRTGKDTFHIEVWRSFRAYVMGLLEEAGLEFAA